MAGIGFELRKLFVGRGVVRKMRAYAYAGVICSGTMFLAIMLLMGVQELAKAFGAPEHERELLVATMVNALFLSMALTAAWQMLLSRYVADQVYQNRPDKVLPSLMGASVLLMIPGAVIYGGILLTVDALSTVQKLIAMTLFLELVPVWLEMTYITAAKDYTAVLKVFALGVGLALVLGVVLLSIGWSVVTSLLLALSTGYGVMLVGFMRVLLRYFPLGRGSLLGFLSHLSRTPDLLLSGFLSMAGAFAHIVLMWYSPLGMPVSGALRHAPTFDAAAFYAFLVTVPTNINFIVSVEVNFYTKYRQYFDAITLGASVGRIAQARDAMRMELKQELSKLCQVQVFFATIYVVVMRYLLAAIGFTSDMIAMFQVMSIGYSAYAIGNCVMLLQLYFNDRGGAMITSATFFAVNVVVTLWTLQAKPLFYGMGIAAGGIAMYAVSIPQLLTYVKRIDYHVFCSQPVVNDPRIGKWARLATWLDTRAERAAKPRAAKAARG